MKHTINKINSGQDELILNYRNLNSEVEKIIQFMQGNKVRLLGKVCEETVNLKPEDILYIESVEDKVFAYTVNSVVKLDYTLIQLENLLNNIQYFRCGKSIIINIDKVEKLKSLPSNRIDAVMQGGYHIIISRKYASEFRRILKGDN